MCRPEPILTRRPEFSSAFNAPVPSAALCRFIAVPNYAKLTITNALGEKAANGQWSEINTRAVQGAEGTRAVL